MTMAKMPTETVVPQISPELTERRYIYNGDKPSPPQRDQYAQRGNRPLRTRKRSPLKIAAMIMLVSAVIVFYVWNKIVVDKIANEIAVYEKTKTNLDTENKRLNQEIGQRKILLRIEPYAKTKLGMSLITPPLKHLSVDFSSLEKLEAWYKSL